MKTLLARWIANRLERRARTMRRSLRDYHRHQSVNISVLEQRSRGLRLYVAWAHNLKGNPHHEEPTSLRLHTEPHPAFPSNVKAAA